VPISCSLARNAPLRSFVGLLWVLCGPLRSFAVFCGPLRSFAVFSHTASCLTVFTARCYASAVLAMGLPVSVRLSQVGVLIKRLTQKDHTNNTTRWPRESSFLTPKISTKFDRVTPYGGAKCRLSGSKSATFDK